MEKIKCTVDNPDYYFEPTYKSEFNPDLTSYEMRLRDLPNKKSI